MHFSFYAPASLPTVGGLQYVIHYWATNLAERGHTVTVITPTPDKDKGENQWPYQVLRGASVSANLRAMRKADLILMFNVNLKVMPLILLSGKPFYVNHQTALWDGQGKLTVPQTLKLWVANHLAKANVACSSYIAKTYKHSTVILNPFRRDIFKPGNLPRHKGEIFFMGRLVSDKGADLLVEAFANLVAKGFNGKLIIAGDGPDKSLLQTIAKEKGVTDKVSFVGMLPQAELVKYMHTCEIMVVPSRMEPMGMVVPEGLACGCTMVVARQGGMPEGGGAFCHYFEPNSVEDLTKVLHQLLENPVANDQQALAEHLRQFSIEHTVDHLLKVIQPVKG